MSRFASATDQEMTAVGSTMSKGNLLDACKPKNDGLIPPVAIEGGASGLDENGGPVFTFDSRNVVSMTKMSSRELTPASGSFRSMGYQGGSSMEAFGLAPLEGSANWSKKLDGSSASALTGGLTTSCSRDGRSGLKTGPNSFQYEKGFESPDYKYPVDVQQWRETGFATYRYNPNECMYPGNGFWRPAYGGYPVSGPSSALSRGSSRDDLTSVEGQIFEYEERFRVDRRKLELLMIGRFEPVKEQALEFFQRVGEESSTSIIWPSRLKIGAKSKKDPHIRIGGTEECVKRAKAVIMEYLDTKATRVTMKMDVSYTDHSHVIGKGGNTIRRVMAETGCHIHFPDSNRSNPNEKSNQVSIAGEVDGVEKARARVRELAPLVFTFDLPIMPSVEAVTHDPNDPYLKAIQEQYNIQLMFRQKQKNFPTTVVIVKGCEWEASRVKEATLLLVEHLCGRYNTPPNPASSISDAPSMVGKNGGDRFPAVAQTVPISMNMEISPIHHSVVLGKGNMTLRSIMQRTKTTILFPDAGDPNIPPIRKGSVTISGSIHNVYFARQQLLGSLPLVLMFELPDNLEMADDEGIQKLQEELDVCISIKPKQRQSNKSVLVKAQERNASSIYKVRQVLLGLEGDPIEANIPETYKMQPCSASQMNVDSSVHDLLGNRRGLQRGFAGGFNPMCPPPAFPCFSSNDHGAHARRFSNHIENGLQYPGENFLQTFDRRQSAYNPYKLSNGPCPATPNSSPMVFEETGGCFQGVGKLDVSSAVPGPAARWNPAGILPPEYLALGNSLPPNHPYLQEYALLVLKNITRLQQLEGQSRNFDDKPTFEDPNNNFFNAVLGQDTRNPSESGSAGKLDSKDGSSPRNSSPVHELGNLTNQLALASLDFTRAEDGVIKENLLNCSGDLAGISHSSASRLGSASSNGEGSHLNVLKQLNGDISQRELDHLMALSKSCSPSDDEKTNSAAGQRSSSSGGDTDGSACDWRAPGWEKKTLEMAAKNQICEYDTKRLLAAKALQIKPHSGEERMPTPTWSGLGFSSSMPESLMKEQLGREGISLDKKLPNPRQSAQGIRSGAQVPNQGTNGLTSRETAASSGSNVRTTWFGNTSALDSLLHPKGLVNCTPQLDDDLPSLFAKQGLAKYTDLFLRHEVDIQTFATLTEQDLKEIGIQTFGARKKLLLLANKVKQVLSVNDSKNRW